MTDLELIEIVADWCGFAYKVYDNYITIKRDVMFFSFNPLKDWNDLMTVVVPKLFEKCNIGIEMSRKGFLFEGPDAPDIVGDLPDLPRAICELVAKLAKERKDD